MVMVTVVVVVVVEMKDQRGVPGRSETRMGRRGGKVARPTAERCEHTSRAQVCATRDSVVEATGRGEGKFPMHVPD